MYGTIIVVGLIIVGLYLLARNRAVLSAEEKKLIGYWSAKEVAALNEFMKGKEDVIAEYEKLKQWAGNSLSLRSKVNAPAPISVVPVPTPVSVVPIDFAEPAPVVVPVVEAPVVAPVQAIAVQPELTTI